MNPSSTIYCVHLDKPLNLSLFPSTEVDYVVYLIGWLEGLNEIMNVTGTWLAAAVLFSNVQSLSFLVGGARQPILHSIWRWGLEIHTIQAVTNHSPVLKCASMKKQKIWLLDPSHLLATKGEKRCHFCYILTHLPFQNICLLRGRIVSWLPEYSQDQHQVL